MAWRDKVRREHLSIKALTQMAIPILLIPGLSATPEVFLPHLEALWRFGPVTVANHWPGGSMAAIATAILADAPPRFALLGFSMGGYIAFEIMRQAPERVLRLALVDTSARPDAPAQTEKRRQAMALTAQGKFREAAMASFASTVHPDHGDDPGLRAVHLRMAEATGPETYTRHQQAIIGRADSRPDLGGVDVPTLVLVGEDDQLTPPEIAHEMAAGIAGATLVVVPGAGHMALIEQPDSVRAALVEWLSRPIAFEAN